MATRAERRSRRRARSREQARVRDHKVAGDVDALIEALQNPVRDRWLTSATTAADALGDLRAEDAVPDLIGLLDAPRQACSCERNHGPGQDRQR